MLFFLILLVLNQVNASEVLTKDGTYSQTQFGLEIKVKDGEAVSAQVFNKNIPLSKTGDDFYGSRQDNNQKTSIVISRQSKKRLLAELTEEIVLAKDTPDKNYKFDDTGIILFIKNDLITTLYIGLNNKPNLNEIQLDTNGEISNYVAQGNARYLLNVENSEIKTFYCNNCRYSIYGNKNNILMSEGTYMVFKPSKIELYYMNKGIKQTINTANGTFISVNTFFYKQNDILSSSEEFSVEPSSVTYKIISKFIAKKSL